MIQIDWDDYKHLGELFEYLIADTDEPPTNQALFRLLREQDPTTSLTRAWVDNLVAGQLKDVPYEQRKQLWPLVAQWLGIQGEANVELMFMRLPASADQKPAQRRFEEIDMKDFLREPFMHVGELIRYSRTNLSPSGRKLSMTALSDLLVVRFNMNLDQPFISQLERTGHGYLSRKEREALWMIFGAYPATYRLFVGLKSKFAYVITRKPPSKRRKARIKPTTTGRRKRMNKPSAEKILNMRVVASKLTEHGVQLAVHGQADSWWVQIDTPHKRIELLGSTLLILAETQGGADAFCEYIEMLVEDLTGT